jgi:phosphoribosylformylglycinamidine synthase
MLSESQERMLLVAQKGREEEVFRIFQKWGLDAVEIGRVTSDAKMRVLEHGEVVAELPNAALTDDAPVYKRPLARWEPPVDREMPEHIKLAESGDFSVQVKRLLASPNICSKRWVWQQYDHMVQTNTVDAPGAGDAGVIRIKGSNRGLAMALDGNSYARGRRSRPQSSLRRSDSDRCHQLPQLRQPRKAAHYVAVFADD